MSDAFYGDAVPVHQVLWAGKDGRLPGEPGCDPHAEHRQDLGGNAAACLAASQRSLGTHSGERIPYTVFFEFPGSTVEDAVNSLRIAGHLAAAEQIKGARGWWMVRAAAFRDLGVDPHAWYNRGSTSPLSSAARPLAGSPATCPAGAARSRSPDRFAACGSGECVHGCYEAGAAS